jgi:hypothetical protein
MEVAPPVVAEYHHLAVEDVERAAKEALAEWKAARAYDWCGLLPRTYQLILEEIGRNRGDRPRRSCE